MTGIFDVSDLEDDFLEDAIKDTTGMMERRKGTMDEEIHKQMLEFLVAVKLDHIKSVKKERQRIKAEVEKVLDEWKQTAILSEGKYTADKINFVLEELKKRLGIK